VVSSVAIAVIAPLPYLTTSLRELGASDGGSIAANYADRPAWVVAAFYLHVMLGGLAMLTMPLQISSRVRARWPRLHRVAGRIAIVSILVAAIAGLLLSPFSVAGATGTAGFGTLAVLWFSSTVLTYRTIRAGDVAAHRQWAVRAFALTYSAVTLRLWLGVLMGAQIGLGGVDGDLAFDRAYVVVPFLCWVPNLIAAELYLRRRPA